MLDPALVAIATVIETQPNAEIPITLLVGGFMVTGKLVSAEEFFGSSPGTAAIGEGVDSLFEGTTEDASDGGIKKHRLEFLHVLGAHFLRLDGDAVPTQGNAPTLRVSIAHVAGFFLGEATRTHVT